MKIGKNCSPRFPHHAPRAADCRPYGVERGRSVIGGWGRSVIGGRGRFVIGGRADTQVGPYKTQGALESVRVPPQRPAERALLIAAAGGSETPIS